MQGPHLKINNTAYDYAIASSPETGWAAPDNAVFKRRNTNPAGR